MGGIAPTAICRFQIVSGVLLHVTYRVGIMLHKKNFFSPHPTCIDYGTCGTENINCGTISGCN